MSNKDKAALVPKLRFLEFRSEGGWTPRELGDCLDYLQPTQYLVNSTAYNDNYEIPVVTAGKTFILGHTDEIEGVFDQPLPVIIFDDFTTATQYVDFRFKAKSSAMKILLAKQNANIKFIYESMQQIDYEVGAHGRHWISAYSKIKVAVPNPNEQQKIADCLSSLDELIAAQARKVDALKSHKKGLMQQLFPREDETQPRLRFPEFRDTGDWEKSQLNRLTTKISDGIHTTPVYEENGEYAFINGNNLVNGRVLVDEKTKRVSIHEFTKHRKTLNANTILMSINGTIGNLALFRNEQVVLGKSACFINVDIHLADSVFIYYLLQTDSVQSVFNAELTGSTIKNLSLGTIKNAAVSIPKLLEQQRIASFLFLLDDLITAASQEFEILKTHKKGLMQQLFPSVEGDA
jgi:type I restriction enzyme, S subunit